MFLDRVFDFPEIILEDLQQRHLDDSLREINNFLDQRQEDRFRRTVFYFFLFLFELLENIGDSYRVYMNILVAVSSLKLRPCWPSGRRFLCYRAATQPQRRKMSLKGDRSIRNEVKCNLITKLRHRTMVACCLV